MGLERDLFLSPPDANLVCDLCNDVMDNPTTACGEGHTFCGPCLANAMGVPPPKTGTSWNHTWLAASTTRCPSCSGELLVPPAPNRPLLNIIRALRVRCPYHAERERDDPPRTRQRRSTEPAGSSDAAPRVCMWQGESDTLEAHLRVCDFADSECSFGCGKRVERAAVESHSAVCPCRPVTCPSCEEAVPFRAFKVHDRECPEKVVPCQYCSTPLKRSLHGKPPRWKSGANDDECKEGHYSVCPKLPLHCPLRPLGCYHNYKREDTIQHFVDSHELHATLMSSNIVDVHRWMNWEMVRIVWEIDREQLHPGSQQLLRLRSSSVNVAGEDVYVALELCGQDDPVQVFICAAESTPARTVSIDGIYVFAQIDPDLSVNGASFETAQDEAVELVANLWDFPDKCYGQRLRCNCRGAAIDDPEPGEIPFHLEARDVTRRDLMTSLQGAPPAMQIRSTFRVHKRNTAKLVVRS